VCADSLKETPQTVLRDVLAILRDESEGGAAGCPASD
jgi:hypothetical protein